MNIKDRLLKYIEYKEISKLDFTKKANLVQGFFNKGQGFNVIYLKNILNAFPDLNLEWLITGKGEMIKKSSPEVEQIKEMQEKLKLYEELIASLKETNELLKKQLAECERNQKNSIHSAKTSAELKK